MAPINRSAGAALLLVSLACLLIGEAQLVAGARRGLRPHGRKCARMPDSCCRSFDWRMMTDPMGWEEESGCRIKCCQSMMRNRSCKRAGALRNAMERGLVQDFAACVARLIENFAELNLDLPKICCKIPFVSVLPACS